MSETPKTLIFIGIAVVMGLLAYLLRPAPFEQPRQQAGELLFADVDDASAADALEIVRYDAEQSKAVPLKIRRDGGQWVIASHNDYPADASDAKDRIEEVALKLMDLEVIEVASELTSDHGLYGVVSPEGEAVKEADEDDIGMLVGLEDDDGNILAQVIVGKQAHSQQSDAPKRFVRKAGESVVYTANIDTEQLTSDFSDWIESDLLNILGSDIRRVNIKDYNVHVAEARGPDGQTRDVVLYEPRFEMSVAYDQDESQWKFVDMVERRGNRLVPSKLSDDEQLNQAKLDELKNAVDNLKIVDVASKPKELVEGVKSEEDLINDPRIGPLLEKKGFYPSRGELLSSDGEVRVQTEDGIEYVLRFGKEAGVERDEDGESKLTRYMLISARVAEEQFAAPDASTMPPASDKPAGPALGAGGAAGDEGSPGNAAQTTDAPEAEASKDDAVSSKDDPVTSEQPTGNDDSATESDADDTPGEAENEAAPALNPPATVPPGAAEPAADEPSDEMTQKRKAAEEKVAELNQKFANWYYIVSEDEYKKIRLGRFDLIREKVDASLGVDEFQGLDELPPDTGNGSDADPQPDDTDSEDAAPDGATSETDEATP